ncbi:MAG: hypothetical protein ABII23_04595 [bacterium]
MKKTVFWLCGLFLIFACAAPQVRRRNFVAAHPELQRQFKDAVLRGSVFEGMSMHEVKASWGKPQRSYKKIFGSIPARHWEYDIEQPDRIDTYVLIFRNGTLLKMKLKHSKPM